MELDCTMYENVYFGGLSEDKSNEYPITVDIIDGNNNKHTAYLTKEGCWSSHPHAKCVIFPKGKTTWEGFHRPFKDGDIVAVTMYPEGTWIGIFKQYEKTSFEAHCSLNTIDEYYIGSKNHSLTGVHLATEEEKAKLFQAIKDNGYKWNTETKTLEKLIEPKFKVEDKIKSVISSAYYTVVDIKNNNYFIKSDTEKYPYQVSFENEINYKLVPNKFDLNTLVPFESRVLVRENKTDVWQPAFYGFFNQHNKRFYTASSSTWLMCIPYNEDTKHLTGTTDDCNEYFKIWK